MKLTRLFALEVIDLWDAPEVVVEFLETGDKKLATEAAEAAAEAAHEAFYYYDSAATKAALAADADDTSDVTKSIKPFVEILKAEIK